MKTTEMVVKLQQAMDLVNEAKEVMMQVFIQMDGDEWMQTQFHIGEATRHLSEAKHNCIMRPIERFMEDNEES